MKPQRQMCAALRRREITKVPTARPMRILIENCCGEHFFHSSRKLQAGSGIEGPKPADEIRPLVLPSMFYQDKHCTPLVVGGGTVPFRSTNLKLKGI